MEHSHMEYEIFDVSREEFDELIRLNFHYKFFFVAFWGLAMLAAICFGSSLILALVFTITENSTWAVATAVAILLGCFFALLVPVSWKALKQVVSDMNAINRGATATMLERDAEALQE